MSEQSTSIHFRFSATNDASEIARLCGQWGYPMNVTRCLSCHEAIVPCDRDALFVAHGIRGLRPLPLPTLTLRQRFIKGTLTVSRM